MGFFSKTPAEEIQDAKIKLDLAKTKLKLIENLLDKVLIVQPSAAKGLIKELEELEVEVTVLAKKALKAKSAA